MRLIVALPSVGNWLQTEGFLQSFADLASLLISEETVDTTLRRIGDLAVLGLPACDAASVSLVEADRVASTAFTNDLAEAADGDQYATGEGPCLSSIEERNAVLCDVLAGDERWPRFRDLALARGVGSVLSLPLVVDGIVGSLNLYSMTASGFTPDDRTLAGLFGAQAAVALANAKVHERDIALATQLEEALASRAIIDQAKGIIMARDRCTAEEAFDSLRVASQAANRKLRDIARDVVDGAASTRASEEDPNR